MRRFCSILCVAVVGCASVEVRPTVHGRRAYIEHREPGVLVVALGVDTEAQDLREVQLKIVAKAARNGAVLVLASSSEQLAKLEEICTQYDDLCDRIYDGTVRVIVEPHRGVWVRDFGPYITADQRGRVFVIDAKYDDARLRRRFEYRRAALNEERQTLLERQLDSPDEDTSLFRERNDALLRYGAELVQLYKDEGDSRWRAMDDDAPYYVAEGVLGDRNFELEHTPIFLDGGNLFTLEDGTCLTTTDTIAKNGGDRILVERELLVTYRCGRVVFLEALAGENIIKHLDMFLMPVKNRTLLLASYDPDSVRFRERFESLDGELRQLVVASAVAMSRNKLRLKKLGYSIVDVPSLFPRRSAGTIYFPTLLNGVVQVGRNRRRHVLLPDYETTSDHEVAVKREAKEIVQKTFEPGVDVQTIEATAPARLQGALHCLTNSIPWAESVFAKDDGIARGVRDRIAKFTPSAGVGKGCLAQMFGEWRQLRDMPEGRRSSTSWAGLTMFLEKSAMRIKDTDHEFSEPFIVSCNPLRPNEATLKFEHRNWASTATLRHDSDDTVVLTFDGTMRLVFVRPAALLKRMQKAMAAEPAPAPGAGGTRP